MALSRCHVTPRCRKYLFVYFIYFTQVTKRQIHLQNALRCHIGKTDQQMSYINLTINIYKKLIQLKLFIMDTNKLKLRKIILVRS